MKRILIGWMAALSALLCRLLGADSLGNGGRRLCAG